MSLYNTMHGVTQATFFVLPMLGKHPDEYPRFRNCFSSDEEYPEYDDCIHVYTRAGGGNRDSYDTEISELRSMDGYITDFDDSFDSTFASFVFSVPDQFKDDFQKYSRGDLMKTSPEYQAILRAVFPKLSSKFDEIFESATVEPKG